MGLALYPEHTLECRDVQMGLGQPRLPTVEATKLLLHKYGAQTGMKFVTIDSWA